MDIYNYIPRLRDGSSFYGGKQYFINIGLKEQKL